MLLAFMRRMHALSGGNECGSRLRCHFTRSSAVRLLTALLVVTVDVCAHVVVDDTRLWSCSPWRRLRLGITMWMDVEGFYDTLGLIPRHQKPGITMASWATEQQPALPTAFTTLRLANDRMVLVETMMQYSKILDTQCRVFKRWVNSQLKQVCGQILPPLPSPIGQGLNGRDVNGHEIAEVVDVFRDPEALLTLARELANRKASTSNFRPSDGISTQENAISLIERLYGHDVAAAIQLACDTYQRADSDLSPTSSPFMRLTLGLDALWILAVAAGAGTGPIEDVQEASGTVRGSVDSSTSTLIGQRSKRSSLSSVPPEAELSSIRTPLLDRWLTRQDERLLAWCQDVTQSYEGVNICNYTTSWRDGLAFLAIINQQRPELFNYRFRLEKSPMQNLGLAFHLITKEFAVARLLEPEDLLSNDAVDARSIAIYLIELRSAVEIDRRRRNKPAFEIRTAAMENQAQSGQLGEPDAGVTVTVVTTSSRSSSPTASELTFCSEETSELDDVSHLEDTQVNLAEFQHQAERSLAWMLSMEERLSDNCADLKVFTGDGKVDEKTMFQDSMTVAEKADLIALEKSPIDDVKSLNEAIVSRLMEARKHFNTHEDLAAHLAKHEPIFRRCLRYGQRLANLAERVQRISNTTPSSTTGDDSDSERQPIEHLQAVQPGEVMKMLNLLQNRWTNLNRAAAAGNRFLAGCLLNRQEAVLSAVEIQLGKLEWERDRQATERFGTTVKELKSQLVANRRLENHLESGEKLAQHMQDMVILVPSETPNARDADLEERIATLATQWSRLVEWVHTHYAQLQNALLHWRHFEEEADVLAEWLSQLEREARGVEERKTREMEQGMTKNGGVPGKSALETEEEATQEARLVSEAVSDAVAACLSRYETRWAQLLASLDRRASAVREACGDSIEIQHAVESRVDALVSRWSQLTEPQLDAEENLLTTTPKFAIPMMQQPAEVQLREGRPTSDGTKRPADDAPSATPEKRVSLESGRLPLIPTGYRAEFESRAEKLLNWLDAQIDTLELVTMKASDEQRKTKAPKTSQSSSTPSEVIARVDKELPDAKEDMVVVNSLGERYRRDLSQAGEAVDELDQLFDDIEERWGLLDQLYKKATLQAVERSTASKAASSDETASQKSSLPPTPPLPGKSPQNTCRSVESFRQWLASAKSEATCPINCADGSNLDELISNFTHVVQLQPKTAIVEQFLASLKKSEAQELTEAWQEVRRLIGERVPVLQNLCENHDLFIIQSTKNTLYHMVCEQKQLALLKGGHSPSLSRKPTVLWRALDPSLLESSYVEGGAEEKAVMPNQIERFEKLMGDMFDYLDSVAQATNAQPPAIEAQLGESIEALRDMEKMQPTLGHLDGIVEELKSFFSEPYIKKLSERLGELKRTWNRVKELTNENILFLRGKLESAIAAKKTTMEEEAEEEVEVRSMEDKSGESIASLHSSVQESPITVTSAATQNRQPDTIVVRMLDMDELQKWISKAKHRLAKYATIKNRDEMDGFANFLEGFEKELTSKRPMITAIRNGEVTDATGKPVSEKTALLFSGHFADLESEYAAGQERLKSATYHFNDFKSLMSYEKHWLERVDSMIRKSKQQVFVDISDISDDIMAFENLKSEHSEDDFSRLKKIVELLSSEGIMSQQLNTEFETYATGVTNALKQLIQRLEELKKLKERTEEIQIRLDDYESWLSETLTVVQQRMGEGKTADSSQGDFLEWCTHTAVMDGVMSNLKRDIAKASESDSMEARMPDSLAERMNSIQVESSNLKRHLLLFTYPTDVRNSIQRCREATREHDVAAINLEIVSLTSEHVAGLIKKCGDVVERIRDSQNLIEQLQNKVSVVGPPPELLNSNTELMEELRDLYEKNTKILDHAKQFREGVEKLQPFADRYSQIIDPMEQVMMNVEEVTDYLETADTQNSHIEMLQRVLTELSEVLGREEREPSPTSLSIPDDEKSTLQKLEELLVQIEAEITPTEGLNSTIADVRRVIDKAFAARNAFRVQVSGLVAESNESSATEITEIRVAPQQSAACLERTQKPPAEVDRSGTKSEAPDQILSILYTRSNQLTSEMVAFFEDLATFNKFCVNLNQSVGSQRDGQSVEPFQTTISKSRKKIEYFKLQSQYLESRLKDLLKAAEVLSQEDKKIVLKVQKLWFDSKSNLSWELEQFNQLATLLKEAELALSKYERLPTESNRQACLTYLAQLEDTYNWSLTQDRVRLDEGEHVEVARRLTASNQPTDLLAKLTPFREGLQQFVTQLNEIQDELHSCQSIPTHELSSQIQSLDQYFILAQEAASKATNTLLHCKTGQPPVIVENEGENELLASVLWLDVILETQKGRLNAYCNEFHLCRPYWQEYATLWQSFMNEAIRQKHQIEMLQLDRLPNEDRGSKEVNVGSARDYAVNLCSSVLTLQRLGSRIVWKAQNGQIGSGLDADLYLQPVFDKRCSRRPLRLESTLRDDIAFVNETFDTLVEDLRGLATKYSIESFLPPNLRIDATRIDDYQVSSKSDSFSDSEELQETTFPNTQNQKYEDIGITDFEACLNRLKEELVWLQENDLYIPIIDTPSNYISKLDSQFWLLPGTSGPIRMCSKWVKKKSQELAKLDTVLKAHERRSAQLCAISEKVSSSLEDMEAQRQLHEAADELHACMDAARGMIDRRRTRLCDWLSTCTAIEAAMLMDSDGEEVEKAGEQVLPRWIATIRERLEKSSPSLDSPTCKKELEQLRSEFSPTGNGTGQTLRVVEEAFENYQSDARLPLHSTHRNCVTPQLEAGVVRDIEKSLAEWKSVCRLLRIDQAGEIIPQTSHVHQTSMSSPDSNLEASVRKLAFWLDTVTSYLNSTVACLGGDFNQNAVIAHIKNRVGDKTSYTVRSLYPAVIQIQLQQYAIELDARKPQLDKLAIETERLGEELRTTDNTSTGQLSAMVNELVNETSSGRGGRGELNKSNCSLDDNNAPAEDLIPSHSRSNSQPDCFKKSPSRQRKNGTKKRLSLVEIFGDNVEPFSHSNSKLSEVEILSNDVSVPQEEVNKCTETSDTGKRLLLSESTKRKSPSLPSMSELLEEGDGEKSTANSARGGVISASPGLEVDSTLNDQPNVDEQLNEVKSTLLLDCVDGKADSSDPADAVVEEVRQCWNATSAQVKARLEELEKMMTVTEELKALERELDRWLSRAESDLANALSNTQDITERKRIIQDIIDRLPTGETKFTTHQNKCEAILAKYSKEDTQKFRADQEAIQMRWSQLVSRLRESLEGPPQPDSDLIEIPIASRTRATETDLQKIVRLRTISSQQSGTYNPNEHFIQPESRSMESSMIENYRSGGNSQEPSCSTLGRHGFDQKPLLGESYRTHQLSRSADIRSRPYDSSRPSPRMTLENWPLFLAQLRQMNDWLAHQDANFHQLKGTVGGDSESVSQLINSFSVLEEELRLQRFQVEDLLDRGQMFMRDQLAEGRYGFSTESEGESDGSEFDPGKSDVDESVMSTKRVVRRIRRHLSYLDKHWTELNRSMLAYRQQLDRAFQKLTVFERVLDDAERELEAAQKVLMTQDPAYPTDERTLQIIWDTFASVTHAIAGLDGQALCLSDDGTIISHVLISRLDGLKIGLERLRSEANEGLNHSPSANGAGSGASPAVMPVFQRALRSPPQHLINPDQIDAATPANGGNAPIPRPKSPSECWLQAFQTVSYPWERCLLPSGNQVPYYKNHATQETQWDHPLMIELLQRMDERNTIRFLAYRTAAKIRQLQLKLFFDQIPLNVATETFARHGLSSPLCSEGCDGRVMDVAQMVNCLTTLYCRVWDALANQPDVVKTIDTSAGVGRNGMPSQQSPTKSCTSESTLAGTNGRQTSMTENTSFSESRPKSKKTPTHRSAIKCMSNVLCATSNKHSRGDEGKSEKGSECPRQSAMTPSLETPSINERERGSPGNLPPPRTQPPPSAFSRVEKLRTRLQLPDGREFVLPTCVDLALNLLLNSFDRKKEGKKKRNTWPFRTDMALEGVTSPRLIIDGTESPKSQPDFSTLARNGTIRVLSFKVTIFLLVNATLDEKYQYLFSLVADRDNKINDSRLWLLVYEIMQLPRQLGEAPAANSANSSLDPNILMCFKKNLKTKGGHEHRSASGGIIRAPSLDSQISAASRLDDGELLPSVGLDRFYEWLKLEPPIVAWLPALHRLIAGEKLIHQVRCAVCQACPIRGLRYRCLRCLNFDLCQNCFLIGRVEKSHKVTHPIQEYTTTLQRSDSLRDFSRVVRNRFRSKEKFRQSSFNTEDLSKSTATTATAKSVGRATPTLYDRPPRAVPIRQNSTGHQNTSSSPSLWQANRPASLGETRKRMLYSTPSASGVDVLTPRVSAKPRRGGSMDQEHELIAQYSHSLRRQQSLTPTGAMMPSGQPLLYYGPQDSVHSLGAPWLYGSATYDRSRPPEPRFFTMRPNQLRGSSGFRASSQPPPHPGPGIYVTGPPLNTQPRWYRNPSGWEGPMVAGSAGSLDKVLMNLEEENRFLRAEYDRLRMQSPAQNLRPLRSPSLQYPLSQMGLYQDTMYHSAYGNPHFPSNAQMNPQLGYGQPMSQLGRSQTERIYPASNGVFYSGSLGRGSGAAAYSAFLRSNGSGRVTFDSANQRYQGKPSPVTASQQPAMTPTQESELAQETRLLRQHKTRLESRMQLLEDHNKALEDQLNRLRQYLNIPPPPPPSAPPTSTNPVSLSVPGQTYTRENGSIDQQSGGVYTGTQYLPISDHPSPSSATVAPLNSVGFNQGTILINIPF
ncbi:Dystrophin isoform E [Taenia solium]|eukprot:TsM_000422500 transcript=TsM_000422500 gene=TsM_000422500